MAKITVSNFINQVNQELSKVTWIGKKDIVFTTIMVLVVVMLASVFFLVVDWGIFKIVNAILGI